MRILKKSLKFVLLFVVLLLVVLPYAGKYAAIHFLKTEKNIEANISDLSINLFTGVINLQGVHLYGETAGELHLGELAVDLSMLELFNKNILIESINFNDFKTNVTELDKAWNVGGVVIPLADEEVKEPENPKTELESEPFDWGYGVRTIAFSNIKVDVSSQYTDSKFILNELKIKDLLSWYPANISELILDLSINGDTFRINGDASPFINQPIVKTKVRINDMQLQPFLKSVKDLPFDEASVALFSDFDLEIVAKEDQLQLDIKGNYGFRNIHLKDKDRIINLEKLSWDGEQNIILPTQGAKIINLDGLFAIDNLDVVDVINNAHLSQKKMALTGKYAIKLDEEAAQPGVVALAALRFDQVTISTVDEKAKLLSFDNWEVKEIKVASIADVNIGLSELNNLLFLKDVVNEKLPPMASLDKFIVNKIHYQSTGVEIEKLEFRHLNADVRLDKQGKIPALEALIPKQDNGKSVGATEKQPMQTSPETAEKQTTEKSADEKQFAIVLKEILVNSESNIRFVDNSVTPVFDTKLHNLKLSVNNIDSTSPGKPTVIDLGVKIDEYGQFVFKGDAYPFSEKVNAKLVAKLQALELTPLSSYAGKYAGINIKRGTLDLDADIKIKDNILDVKNTFYMNQLNVESDESEKSDSVFKDMPMPLDLTLDVLRDNNNVIKLDIPVKGKVSDPDFRLQDIYNTAMVKAMKFAATHYLMQAVQPLGLVLTAGKLVGKAMAPKFDPLIFEIGSSEISKANQQHIAKLAKILQDKDKLRFTICGNATESDWKFIQPSKQKATEATATNVTKATEEVKVEAGKKTTEANTRGQILLKLANDRTKLVKKLFVDKYKIAPKRLFACNGKIAKDTKEKAAVPSVEITL